jgi:predicted TIM-barrel fold metal-dependent hydrolase
MPQPSVSTRRQMLATAALSTVAGSVIHRVNAMNQPASATDKDTLPWIDAHSHIWSTDLKKYPLRNNQTVEALEPRSFTDEELMALAMPEGVGRVILIQHYPHHGYDNSYLIDTWKKHPERFRIVGQIDSNRPHVDQTMRDMLQTGVTGFRIGPQSKDDNWLSGDGMKTMWKTAAETRQSICGLINPWNISKTGEWCNRYPDTPVVIDHFARIGADGTIRDEDVKNLCSLSKHKLVRVKISAYYALGKKQPPYLDLIPMIKRLFDAYGPDRLMWASDCPYQLEGSNTYAASVALVHDHLDFVSAEDRRKLLSTTAENTFFFAGGK